MTDIYDLMQKYGKLMASQEYPTGDKAGMVLQTEDGIFATKEGADMGNLTEGDIIRLGIKKLPVPQKDMKAMVFSQTPYCMRCLKKMRSFRASLDDMAQIIGPQVKVADGRGGKKKSEKAASKALRGSVGCLVLTGTDDLGEGEGYSVTMGRNLYEAIVAMTVLEKNAEVTVLSDKVGGAKPLRFAEALLMRNIYKKKYSAQEEKVRADEASGNYDPSAKTEEKAYEPEEAALRQALVDCGISLLKEGLVQGTWGNISVRLNDKQMLVTPSGLDYLRLGPDDMVKVDIDSLEYEGDLKPTSEKGLHAEVYKRRPDVSAVIHTHSRYLSVFASAEEDMPVLEDYQDIFGTKVAIAGYALPGTKRLMSNTASALGDNFGVIMSHHGMAACGKDLDTAFENCRKLEENGKRFLLNG